MPGLRPNPFAQSTDVGQALGQLAAGLFPGPEAQAAAAERRARAEERQAQADYRRLQIEQAKAKKAEAERAQQEALAQPSRLADAYLPGQGDAVTRYRAAGGRASMPSVDAAPPIPRDDEGYDMPKVPMNRPDGYTPQIENMLADAIAGLVLSQGTKSNAEQIAKAGTTLGSARHREQVLAGDDPTRIAQAYFATSGKAPFSATPYGAVLDVSRGTQDEGGKYAGAHIAKEQAQTNLANTQAASSVENRPVVPVFDPTSPTNFTNSTRAQALGQPAPPPNAAAAGSVPGAPTKPPPAAVLKLDQEDLDAIGVASSISADMAALRKQLEGAPGQAPSLQLGPFENLVSQGRNLAGMSTSNSQNYATMRAMLERMRNQSLLLNKGVQTEGDAQRAWNEMFTSLNDPEVVKKRLQEIEGINSRAVALREANIAMRRSTLGLDPVDTTAFKNVPSSVTTAGAPNPIAPPRAPVAPKVRVRYDANGNRLN